MGGRRRDSGGGNGRVTFGAGIFVALAIGGGVLALVSIPDDRRGATGV